MISEIKIEKLKRREMDMENKGNIPLWKIILWAIAIPVVGIVITVFVAVAREGFQWHLVGDVFRAQWIIFVIVIAIVAIPCIFILSRSRYGKGFLVISLLVIGFVFIVSSWLGNEISEVIRGFIKGNFEVGLLASGITIMALALAVATAREKDKEKEEDKDKENLLGGK